jgi:hypothetical protein
MLKSRVQTFHLGSGSIRAAERLSPGRVNSYHSEQDEGRGFVE